MAFTPLSEDDVSGRSLSLGLWYARNQENLRKAGLGALIAIDMICVVFLLLTTWSWVSHMSQTTQIWENYPVSGLNTVNRVVPDPVVFGQSTTLRRDNESIDAVVQMTNPNERYAADLTYEFAVGGQVLNQRTVTLAPGQEFYAAAVRVPLQGDSVPVAEVRTVDVRWRRLVDESTLPEEDWQVSNVSFDVVRLVQDQQQEVSKLDMTLTNGSAYGFVEPEVVVVIKDAGANIVAINSASLNQIPSQGSQELLFQWPERLPDSLSAEVHVNVNRVDEEKRILSRELEVAPEPIDEE